MKPRTLGRWIATLATALAFPWLVHGCGGMAAGGSSNTNWLHDCDSDRDCGSSGLSCECGICTRACDSRDCGDLSKNATCVTPSAAAARACGTEMLGALCTVACTGNDDCRPFGGALQCLGGACLSPPRVTRDASADSSAPDATVPPPSPDATMPDATAPPPKPDGGPVDHASPTPDTGPGTKCSFPDTSMVVASPVVPSGVSHTDDAALAVDDDYVWVAANGVLEVGGTNPGTLGRVPRCGGALEVVLDAPGARKPLINTGAYLYWPSKTGIRRFTKATFQLDSIDLDTPPDGGPVERCLVDMIAQGDQLYFHDNCRQTIEVVPSGRLSHQAIAINEPAQDILPGSVDRHIAATGTDVYWVGNGTRRLSLASGTKTQVIAVIFPDTTIAAVRDHVFVGLGTELVTYGGPEDGGENRKLDAELRHALITSDPYFYWASGTADAPKLMRLAAADGLGSPEVALGPGKIDLKMPPAAYGNRLYWIAKNGRDLMTAVQDTTGP
jgi:hypothetical protein